MLSCPNLFISICNIFLCISHSDYRFHSFVTVDAEADERKAILSFDEKSVYGVRRCDEWVRQPRSTYYSKWNWTTKQRYQILCWNSEWWRDGSRSMSFPWMCACVWCCAARAADLVHQLPPQLFALIFRFMLLPFGVVRNDMTRWRRRRRRCEGIIYKIFKCIRTETSFLSIRRITPCRWKWKTFSPKKYFHPKYLHWNHRAPARHSWSRWRCERDKRRRRRAVEWEMKHSKWMISSVNVQFGSAKSRGKTKTRLTKRWRARTRMVARWKWKWRCGRKEKKTVEIVYG